MSDDTLRSETYEYYSLPFCEEKDGHKYKLEDLGEVLEGDRLVSTPYNLPFNKTFPSTTLCKKNISGKELEKLKDAIDRDYYIQVICEWLA